MEQQKPIQLLRNLRLAALGYANKIGVSVTSKIHIDGRLYFGSVIVEVNPFNAGNGPEEMFRVEFRPAHNAPVDSDYWPLSQMETVAAKLVQFEMLFRLSQIITLSENRQSAALAKATKADYDLVIG